MDGLGSEVELSESLCRICVERRAIMDASGGVVAEKY